MTSTSNQCCRNVSHLGINSEVKAITNEFTKTANQLIVRRIPNQTPIPCERSATGLRKFTTKLIASMRSSKILLMSAKNGARGNAATNIVTKPNWITDNKEQEKIKLKNKKKKASETIELLLSAIWQNYRKSRSVDVALEHLTVQRKFPTSITGSRGDVFVVRTSRPVENL